jgi:hypothetical protein
MLIFISGDSLDAWLADWLRVYINGAQKADGVNSWSASTGRPASQFTMPVNFVHFQCAKVKIWSLLTNIAKLIIAKQQHVVFISNVTFHLIPNKNIKVKIMYFGGTLTMEYGIAFVPQFYPSSQESKRFYSLNTTLFFCYIVFQK